MKKDDIVRNGYNRIALKYNASRNRFNNDRELEYFASLLPKGARILDAGCGCGVPIAKYLVKQGFIVTGIDFSTSMLELARRQVPEAEFLEGDMTQLMFPDGSFEGVVSTYAIIHVQTEKHSIIFQNFYRVLRPGGILFVGTGSDEWEGTEDYMGTTMFWSHPSREKSLSLVKQAGFEIIRDEVVECGGETPYWIFAKK
ncbi:MAG: class I SAM-dependent methyltransferase [Promethearchaeota archaeon]